MGGGAPLWRRSESAAGRGAVEDAGARVYESESVRLKQECGGGMFEMGRVLQMKT
jgi:hypothetical protein